VHPLGDGAQADGPVEHRVEARDHGQKRLRRADIRRRLLAPDMLLPRLQGQPVGLVPVAVDRDTDDPPGIARFIASRQAMKAACGPP
jgi:hypothetical protein